MKYEQFWSISLSPSVNLSLTHYTEHLLIIITNTVIAEFYFLLIWLPL